MKIEPKFYSNKEDDNHCLQAAVMMVLDTLVGETSWDEVDRMTGYEDNLYSWTPRATVSLANIVPGTKLYSGMDYRQFAGRGEQYFKEYNVSAPDWFNLQKEHASLGFNKEQSAAKEAVDKNLVEQRSLRREEIEELLKDYLLIAVVDAGKLAGESWSSGHFVVMYAQDNNNFVLHDPGLPPHSSWIVDKGKFMGVFKNEVIAVPKGDRQFGIEVGRNDPCWCGSGKKYKRCHGA